MRVVSYASAATLCLAFIAGCGIDTSNEAPRPTSEASDSISANEPGVGGTVTDSLFAFLQQVEDDALVEAYAAIVSGAYVRYVRTEQFDGDGYRLAFRERIVRVQADESEIVARDSAGAFRYGYLRRFTSSEVESADPANLAEYVVPDDPAYLSARSREVYTYSADVGTLPGHGEVSIIEIRARPGQGQGVAVQRAQLYLMPRTRGLIAMRVQRRDQALWYREESDLFLSIRRSASGAWVPHHARVETLVQMPLRPVQRFRTISTFFDFENPVTARSRVGARWDGPPIAATSSDRPRHRGR